MADRDLNPRHFSVRAFTLRHYIYYICDLHQQWNNAYMITLNEKKKKDIFSTLPRIGKSLLHSTDP